ncbi:MASE4 domain-containing protein [Azospirillum sp. ST 5-10]|uniref:MASE4 domain-containing protein n=1 Tax=unclassified Azospirillum TaxID=2630922 RepID=UPI003F49BAF6
MATSERTADEPLVLSRQPPSPLQARFAAGVLLSLPAAMALAVPFARVPLAGTEPLLPAYATAVLMTELITAVLLFVLYAIERSRAVYALAVGYLFSALMVVPWALTFPGVFAPSGLLGAGIQSTATVAALRRVAFPVFVLVYVLIKDEPPAGREAPGAAAPAVLAGVLGVAAAVVAIAAFAIADSALLPPLMTDARRTTGLWTSVPASAAAISVAALLLLARRWRSILDLWLIVALSAWLIETLLLGFVSAGRFSVGWWAGRLYGLTSASVVLLVLLAETATLYARLARSVAAEHRVREARLTTMEALSGAIAHEVNQPLASMVSSADAGLRWLQRPVPDLEEARAALARIAAEGHRAGKIIDGIRAAFRRDPEAHVAVDVDGLVHDTLGHCRRELLANRVTVRTDLAGALPPVAGDPVQLQQVLANLIANAVDAMVGAAGRPRVLCIRSRPHEPAGVLVSVEDSGDGLDPANAGRVFEPFFTTKAHGMGLGLMICRSIVEAHGGRLWLSARDGGGTAAHLTLPAAAAGGVTPR